jgi:hypothetical protein
LWRVKKQVAQCSLAVQQDESGQRMEIVELAGHPFFVASQFHPEFKSRPGKAAPLFLGLILAASGASPCFPYLLASILQHASQQPSNVAPCTASDCMHISYV